MPLDDRGIMHYMVEQYKTHGVHYCGGHLQRFVSEKLGGNDGDETYEMIFCMWCGEHVIKAVGTPEDDWQHVSIDRSERLIPEGDVKTG